MNGSYSPLSLLLLSVAAQSQPTIRVNTRLVEVDVVVRAKSGGAVRDLTAADFTVQDQGKPQKIALFTVTSADVQRPKPVPLTPGVVSNRLNSLGEEPVGATVILFDRLNTADQDQADARRQVLNYLRTMTSADRVALYSLTKTLRVVQDFTGDPEQLRKAVAGTSAEHSNDLDASDPTDLLAELPDTGDAITNAMMQNSIKELADHAIKDRALFTARVLEVIAKHLGGLPGRKKLVWITSGFEASTTDMRSHNGLPTIEHQDFGPEIDKATRVLNNANVAVYPIDPRGLVYNTTQGWGLSLPGMDSMNLVAAKTGGRAIYATNDLAEAIHSVDRETEVTYTLGFYPAEEKFDGAYHSLAVKVARKDMDVHARKGYFASEGKPPTEKQRRESLNEIFLNPLEATEIALAAKAMPLASGQGYQLNMRVNVSELHLDHVKDAQQRDLWVALVAVATEYPAKKPPNGSLEEIKITLTEDRLREVLRDGFTIHSELPVTASKGTLRVVLLDRATGAAGSVRLPLEQIR